MEKLKRHAAASIRRPSMAMVAAASVRTMDVHPNPHTLGRNDPCRCGSGKKYKKCCLDGHRRMLAAGYIPLHDSI